MPAFVGLGAPYWKPDCRGAVFGLTRNSGPAEMARAALESVGYQTRDLLEAMRADWQGAADGVLRVDGGMSAIGLGDAVPVRHHRRPGGPPEGARDDRAGGGLAGRDEGGGLSAGAGGIRRDLGAGAPLPAGDGRRRPAPRNTPAGAAPSTPRSACDDDRPVPASAAAAHPVRAGRGGKGRRACRGLRRARAGGPWPRRRAAPHGCCAISAAKGLAVEALACGEGARPADAGGGACCRPRLCARCGGGARGRCGAGPGQGAGGA